MNLSGFTWHLLASGLSSSVPVSQPFYVRAPHMLSERHLPSPFIGRETEFSQYKALSTGCYHQPLPANNCPGHAPRHHPGSTGTAPWPALIPGPLRVLQVFRVHFVGVPGSCWAHHFVPASVKTYSGLIYRAWQLIWIMLRIFNKARPVLINRCLLRKQDHK